MLGPALRGSPRQPRAALLARLELRLSRGLSLLAKGSTARMDPFLPQEHPGAPLAHPFPHTPHPHLPQGGSSFPILDSSPSHSLEVNCELHTLPSYPSLFHNHARNMKEALSAHPARPSLQVAIVVTDGRPQDGVQDVSARARAAGIEIFAIGVGRVDMGTLRQMASEPLDEHVDYVESYSAIEKLTHKFQEAFCVVSDLCATGDHDCEQLCVSTPGAYRCACRDGFSLNSDGKTCTACNGGLGSALDLVFLIDGSKSVRPENFELVKKFINQIVDSLEVSDKQAQVGLVQYSSSVRQEFPLGQFKNKKDIKAAVKKMSYMEKGTMTGQALKYLVDSSFSAINGARPGVPKVGIVFTDGRSQDYISDAAKKAKDSGFRMFAVGVGNAVEDELREIASEPVAEHYFYTADFRTISKIGKKLQIKICAEEDPCECKSIMKFQTKVEDLINSLQQKHILWKFGQDW
ncbi:hypothetical protein IHE44_0008249, partial [Lamprotornis superbus]